MGFEEHKEREDLIVEIEQKSSKIYNDYEELINNTEKEVISHVKSRIEDIKEVFYKFLVNKGFEWSIDQTAQNRPGYESQKELIYKKNMKLSIDINKVEFTDKISSFYGLLLITSDKKNFYQYSINFPVNKSLIYKQTPFKRFQIRDIEKEFSKWEDKIIDDLAHLNEMGVFYNDKPEVASFSKNEINKNGHFEMKETLKSNILYDELLDILFP